MIEEALSLYKRCFPEDSDAVTDVVFSERLNAADRREKRADGKLVSVLWLVDKKIFFRGRIVPVKHIVGLCTAPEYRNRGYAKALLAETLATLTGTPFVTLYPFDHAFYEKMGFATVSFDDDPPVGATKTSVDADLLVDLYRDFCRDLDYYYIRNREDFAFYKAVNAPFGENYALLDGGKSGFCSPDEYIPRSFSDKAEKKKGVMARIADLSAVEEYFPLPCRLAATDPLVPANNRVVIGQQYPAPALRLPVADLTSALFGRNANLPFFGQTAGHLADRY